MSLLLSAGGWEAELAPQHGGLIAALRHHGRDVLRPLPSGTTEPLEASCFPLVPYCNRVDQARFDWRGETVTLPRNFAPEPHNLHGIGWHEAWEVVEHDASSCLLRHDYAAAEGEGWPWSYRAEQRFTLGESGLRVDLTLTNRSASVMPAGLGFHPYFRRDDTTSVRFEAEEMIPVGDTMIPTGEREPADTFADWSEGTALPPRLVDNCFTGWTGEVRIEDAHGTITMRASSAPHLHVYSPPDGSALCFEPVTHEPDALNQWPASMILLPPGTGATVTMQIDETPA